MLEEGTMIKIDYTAKVEDENGGTVFDTTIAEIAQEQLIYNPEKEYEPMLVVIGKGWIPVGLEKALKSATAGDEFSVTVPCQDAYGLKDPSKIKLVARREFQKLSINPSIGDRITIGNQTGTVLSVSTGRVRMDYNHILAGKDIFYEIKVHEEIVGTENKIESLLKRRLPGSDLAGLKIMIDKKLIKVYMPEKSRYYEYVQFAKAEGAKDIMDIVPGFDGIEYIDYFDFKEMNTM